MNTFLKQVLQQLGWFSKIAEGENAAINEA